MDIGGMVTSPVGVGLAAVIGRLLPLRAGIALAYWLGDRFADRPEAPDVRAVRFNQQLLSDGQLSPAQLDERVRAVFRNSARGVVEVMHYQGRPKKMLQWVDADEAMKGYIRLTQDQQQRVVFTCPHTGNFDLAGRALRRASAGAVGRRGGRARRAGAAPALGRRPRRDGIRAARADRDAVRPLRQRRRQPQPPRDARRRGRGARDERVPALPRALRSRAVLRLMS